MGRKGRRIGYHGMSAAIQGSEPNVITVLHTQTMIAKLSLAPRYGHQPIELPASRRCRVTDP